MSSLFDDLSGKLEKDPSRMKRGGPRYDLGLLLFNARDSIRDLWLAAEHDSCDEGRSPSERLVKAVEALRPIFGEQNKSPMPQKRGRK